MLKSMLKSIWHRLPIYYQTRLRRPGVFRQARFFEEASHWPLERRQAYQLEHLRQLAIDAYHHTRYYRELFDEHGIAPERIQNFSDFQQIPYLTKDIIASRPADFLRDDVPRDTLDYVTTGGSTGKPLGFYCDAAEHDTYKGFHLWHMGEHGYNPLRTWCAILRGSVIEDGCYRIDREERKIYLSSFLLTDEHMTTYHGLLEELRPPFLRGYPSALTIFARFLEKHHLGINASGWLRGIFTSSEVLSPEQRSLIERVFHAKVYDRYGNSERTAEIPDCPCGHYHEVMEYGYIELKDVEIIENPGGVLRRGELVGTSLVKTVFPMLRYRTLDVITVSDAPCACGNVAHNILSIDGRSGEGLVAKNGNLISITSLNSHSPIFDHTRQIQYYQDTPGKATLRVIPDEDWRSGDADAILAELRQKVGGQLDLDIALVDHVALTPRGKYKYLDQRLKL